jgi:pyrroline-5-carboxylate reductase
MDGTLLIVGGGRMGEALLAGLLAAGRPANEIAVVEVSAARRQQLSAAHPEVTVAEEVMPGDGAVLAVKPGDVATAARAVADAGVRRVLSVAGGVTTASIEAATGAALKVVRAMPNTPALIGAGAAAISPGSTADEDDMAWAEEILWR